jgi:hypothetical protein
MSKLLVAQIDERAKKLGLTRSQFLVQLARADLHQQGDLTIRETPAPLSSGQGSSAGSVPAKVVYADDIEKVIAESTKRAAGRRRTRGSKSGSLDATQT